MKWHDARAELTRAQWGARSIDSLTVPQSVGTNPAHSMAHLSQTEFQEAVTLLAEAKGLQAVRNRIFQLKGLVTRRKIPSAEALARQLYMLSSGLRREVAATFAFQAVWGEYVDEHVGEDGEEGLEKLAEGVNDCLEDNGGIVDGKSDELKMALARYAQALNSAIGEKAAKLDMLMKAVPEVATILREEPLPEVKEEAEKESASADDEDSSSDEEDKSPDAAAANESSEDD